MLTIQRILFPVDVTDTSTKAFPLACALAHRHGATLHLLSVTGRHEHGYTDARQSFPIPDTQLQAWLESEGAGPVPSLDMLSIVQTQMEASSVATQITTFIGDNAIDLVVMGTHGRHGVERMLHGSVAETVIRAGRCPVITVRTDKQAPSDLRQVLAPIDFSDASADALRHAGELAQTFDASVHLLHVVEDVAYPAVYGLESPTLPLDGVIPRVTRELETWAVRYVPDDVPTTVHAVEGYAPLAIVEAATKHDADAIVMSTHGRTGLDHMLLGSVAERVVRQASQPVLVIASTGRSLYSSDAASDGDAAVSPS